MTPWPEARAVAAAAAPSLPPVAVGLADARGRTLATPLRSLVPLPSFDTAAMDGWAVRGPGPWRQVGRVLAGGTVVPPLQAGEAVEVATGAQVPAGCEGVLPYERATQVGGRLTGAPPAGRHVRRTGEECAPGTALLPLGTVVTPQVVGLAAAAGHDTLVVRGRPRLMALVTGDELLTQGLPGAGRVRDAVGPLLAARLDLVALRHLGDDRDLLRRAVEDADADVVLTSGASSAGRADFLPAVLRDLRADVLVDGVAVQPGHPQVLARLPDGRLLVGLPGNPLAALCALVTLVAPLLGRCPGADVGLTEPLARHHSSHRVVPVTVDDGLARPTGYAGSAMLRGAALADGFAVVAPGAGTAGAALFTPF